MKRDQTIGKSMITPASQLFSDPLKDSTILQLLPLAVFSCDADGSLISYNQKAVELWGRQPRKNDPNERFSGAFKLYYPDGRPMAHNQSPAALCLADGKPREEVDLIVERPDHSRKLVRAFALPVIDSEGRLCGIINSLYDLTSQQHTHRELDLKTRELQDYVDNAPIGLHWLEANGIIKWANKVQLDMLGYPEEEFAGHHINEFLSDPEKANELLSRLRANETLNGYEASLRHRDGSVRTVLISSNSFLDGDKFIHTRCFTIDITERKKLFNALKESENRYRQLMNSLQTALYTTDASGVITYYNEAAAVLWGRKPEPGREHWSDQFRFFNPDGTELPLSGCPMSLCLEQKRPVPEMEILVERKDGSRFHIVPHPQPLFDPEGNLDGAINLLVDITEVKRTEQALREREANYRELAGSLERMVKEKTRELQQKNEQLKKNEERYHKMIEEVEDYAIILLDKDGIIQNWNKGAEKIKGYREDEIVGTSFSRFYLPEDRANGLPQKLLNQATQYGKAIHEGWRMRKDGSRFWGSIVLTALHDENKNIIGFSKVTRDLTDKKLAQDKMEEYTRQLEFQNEELEQFAFAASHDMKEPLRKIHFYNSSIADNPANILDEKSREYLDRSLKSVRRMSQLIEDLLRYSKTTSTHENFERVDLNEIVDEIKLMNSEEFEKNEVQIVTDRLPVLQAVSFQMKQLLINLISNSMKYKHPGRPVTIQIRCARTSGSGLDMPGVDPAQGFYKISVIDDGLGFDPKYAERIFDIFQRLNNQTGTKGSGIGLAICKRIVQNHHGYITASGTENQGARFDIYLPDAS